MKKKSSAIFEINNKKDLFQEYLIFHVSFYGKSILLILSSLLTQYVVDERGFQFFYTTELGTNNISYPTTCLKYKS